MRRKSSKSQIFLVMLLLMCALAGNAPARHRSRESSILKDPQKSSVIKATAGVAAAIFALVLIVHGLRNRTTKEISPRAARRIKLIHLIKKMRARKMPEAEIEATLLAKGHQQSHITDALASYDAIIGVPSHWFDKVTEPFTDIAIARKIRRTLRRKILYGEIKKMLDKATPSGEIGKILIQRGWQEKHVHDALARYDSMGQKNG